MATKLHEEMIKRFSYIADPADSNFEAIHCAAMFLDQLFAIDLNSNQVEAAKVKLRRQVSKNLILPQKCWLFFVEKIIH